MNLEVLNAAASRPVTHLSTPEIGALLDAGLIVDSILSQARAEAEKRLQAGEKIEGWELAHGRPRSSIMDPAAVFRILEPIIGENALLDCCSMSLGKVEAALAAHYDVTAKAARETMGKKIGNVILTQAGAAKLSRTAKVVELHAPKETIQDEEV